jgi:MOSC domain-containing protein YiiM
MSARVRSVNVGQPKQREWAGLGVTSIDKRPVAGAVRAHRLGLEGDTVSDTKHHGGVDQAVYAFAREDLDVWGERLGKPIADGQFGENLTTEGIDVNEAVVGTRWRIGTALFEVAYVRTPCNDFKNWMGESGFDNARWVKRFATECRPGPYLRVIEEGELTAGDEIVAESVPDHGITVATMFRAINLDRSLLPQLLQIDDLVENVRDAATRVAEGLPPRRGSV